MLYIPKRHILTTLAHFGFFVCYVLRINLSVAIVAMVNSTYAEDKKIDPECQHGNKSNIPYNGGEFNWDQNQQGLVLSSFFYGYIITQVPGGWWASKYGGKRLFTLGVAGTTILSLLTPIAARASLYVLVVARILEGISQGVTVPAMHAMIAVWSPAAERSRMSVLSYAGMYSGTIFTLPISGLLANSKALGGWPSVFYVLGILGFLWIILWNFFVADTPDKHSTISDQEKKYIMMGAVKTNKRSPVVIPWSAIFRSVPVWACLVAHFCNNWVWFMALTGLPMYFEQVLDFNLEEDCFLSALPFICGFLVTIFSGFTADALRKKFLSTTNTRKLMGCLGFYPTAVFLLLASYTRCDQIGLSVTFMTLAAGILIFNTAGYMVNMIDITQNFSGVIMGLCNIMGTAAGCITPSVTGYLTNNNPTRGQYRKVFAIASGLCLFGGSFYLVFAKSEQQAWDILDKDAVAKDNSNIKDDECILINSENDEAES